MTSKLNELFFIDSGSEKNILEKSNWSNLNMGYK